MALRFLNRIMSSVLAWRLDVTTGQCSGKCACDYNSDVTGHPPTVQHLSIPADEASASTESKFYPIGNSSIILHSHTSGSPFASPQRAGDIDIHVYQQPGCPVKEVAIAVDIPASFAKAILRFRIALLDWCLGWSSLLIFQLLLEHHTSGTFER